MAHIANKNGLAGGSNRLSALTHIGGFSSHASSRQSSSTPETRASRSTQTRSLRPQSRELSIFVGFAAKGIPESEVRPRENVFTYQAWRALGRQVRRGEHGVKVVTFIETKSKEVDQDTGERKVIRRPWTTTVFHVSQTDAIVADRGGTS